MVKRVFIIHRWNGNSKSDWYEWIKTELEKMPGFEVNILNMPNSERPEINSWVAHIDKNVATLDKNTYFIGHSIGCQAILRYLEKVNGKIGGCIFISPWVKMKDNSFYTENDKAILRPWIYLKIDHMEILKKCDNFISFFSYSDPYVLFEDNIPFFKNNLNSKIIIEKNMGHYTSHDNINEVPNVLHEVLSIVR